MSLFDGLPVSGQVSGLRVVQEINALDAEARAILAAAGITPDAAKDDQLLAAIKQLAWGNQTDPVASDAEAKAGEDNVKRMTSLRTASTHQMQSATAFTSAGTAPNYTLTPAPAITAYAANQRFRVKFHAAASAAATLNVSAKGAKSIKQYDATGSKVAAVIAANQLADVEYDGVDFVILDPLPTNGLPLQSGNANKVLKTNGTSASWDGAPTLGVAVASTSGVAIDFTGIPAWVKRITVMFNGVSTNGSAYLIVQIGSGSVQTTGYSCAAATNGGNYSVTSGFLINPNTNAAAFHSGHCTLTALGGNAYAQSGIIMPGRADIAGAFSAGSVTTTGAIDRIRITTTNGTDVFDAGSINIIYE